MKGIDLLRSSPKVMEWLLRDSLEGRNHFFWVTYLFDATTIEENNLMSYLDGLTVIVRNKQRRDGKPPMQRS
jgi:hypothetical protein